MLSIAEALGRVLHHVPRLEVERVPLERAYGRIAAVDVVAPCAVPPWDNSAMDGFAVRAVEAGAGVTLRLLPPLAAGEAATCTVGAGEAMPITTGAPIPAGADAVVIVENTDTSLEGRVVIGRSLDGGQNIRKAGSDIPRGAVVVAAGQVLRPARVGLLASVGCHDVEVVRRARVALLCTGNELVRPGGALGAGQIYSSNPYTLKGELLAAGAEVIDLGDVGDSVSQTIEALRRGLDADAILTTGGVSVGRHDHVKAAFEGLGAKMAFWKVAMKPGKPLAFGHLAHDGRQVALFGLPGNPVSCLVSYHEFVRPWLLLAAHHERPHHGVLHARFHGEVRQAPGRAQFARVTLSVDDEGVIWAQTTGTQSSGALSSMGAAHGLLLVDEGSVGFQHGDAVRVHVLDPGWNQRTTPNLPA